jgi:hypothetical protein
VTGPKLIRDKSIYRATVTYEGFKRPEQLEVSIRDSDLNKPSLNIAKNVTMSKSGSQVVELDVSSAVSSS